MSVPLRLDDFVATNTNCETCLVSSALTFAAELVLICLASSSETSGTMVDVIFLFFPLEATDERDASEATDSSSSDLFRARSNPAIGDVASATMTGARNKLSEVLRALLVAFLGGSLTSSATSMICVTSWQDA